MLKFSLDIWGFGLQETDFCFLYVATKLMTVYETMELFAPFIDLM